MQVSIKEKKGEKAKTGCLITCSYLSESRDQPSTDSFVRDCKCVLDLWPHHLCLKCPRIMNDLLQSGRIMGQP